MHETLFVIYIALCIRLPVSILLNAVFLSRLHGLTFQTTTVTDLTGASDQIDRRNP